MARPRKPLDPVRRSRLLRHARRHFAASGFNATSVSEIIASAKFPKSSFYYFFGQKDTLFDAAFADGLEKLAREVTLPDLATLDANSFWPAVLELVNELTRAAKDLDLSSVAALFHLADAPPSPSLETFRSSAQRWCTEIVRVGKALGHLDREIPDDLYQELAWSIASTVDRWVARNPENAQHAEVLTRQLLVRVLGGQ